MNILLDLNDCPDLATLSVYFCPKKRLLCFKRSTISVMTLILIKNMPTVKYVHLKSFFVIKIYDGCWVKSKKFMCHLVIVTTRVSEFRSDVTLIKVNNCYFIFDLVA